MHDLLQKPPNDLRTTKSGYYKKKIPKKIPETPGANDKHPADHPNAKF